MSDEISSDDIEIIQDFIQESHDMIEQLEPTIIELGDSCKGGACWEILDCSHSDCERHGKNLDFPCWLHMGFIAEGNKSCPYAESEQECLDCDAFKASNGDGETMNAIFRLFHSMKGSAGFLEMLQISTTAHAAENLLDLIRSGKIKMETEHVDLLCRACDFAKEALEYVESNYNDQGLETQANEVTSLLKKAIEVSQEKANKFEAEVTASDSGESEKIATNSDNDEENEDLLVEITPEMIAAFVQEADELLAGLEQGLLTWEETLDNEDIVAELFRNIHSFKGNCGFFQYAELERLSHLMETVLDSAKSGANIKDNNPVELLLKLVDVLKAGIADISNGGEGRIEKLDTHINSLRELLTKLEISPQTYEEEPRVGELLVEKGLVDTDTVAEALETQKKPVGEILVDMGSVTADQVQDVLSEQKVIKQKKEAKQPPKKTKKNNAQRQDIRVDLTKLDALINLIGELVIAENMVIHNPDLEGMELENFQKSGQHMGKIIRDLQEMAMIIRMLPVTGLFRRMIRLVHDISAKSGKKVDLQLYGEETEVDKTVIETITDPLVHLLRNSLDHGLESPEERLAAGKPEKGVINLSASHEEGEVWITIQDDGRGLSRDKLLEKAISKGMIQGDGSDMSDKAVFNLIFLAGFSTADKVTDISGRGVGMDVVRQNLEKIKGKIEISSRLGEGTKVILRIPLTLAIIEGMLIRVGDTKCILPLLAIREIFCPDPDTITVTPDGMELVNVRGEFFPILRMHGVINNQSALQNLQDGILVLVEHQDSRVCLFVNEILGQQQTVIKGLSSYLGEVSGASGCTILGNGEVCLILDVGSLTELVDSSEEKAA